MSKFVEEHFNGVVGKTYEYRPKLTNVERAMMGATADKSNIGGHSLIKSLVVHGELLKKLNAKIGSKKDSPFAAARDKIVKKIPQILSAIKREPSLQIAIEKIAKQNPEKYGMVTKFGAEAESGGFFSDLLDNLKKAGNEGVKALASEGIATLTKSALAAPTVQKALTATAKTAATQAATTQAAKAIEATAGFLSTTQGKMIVFGGAGVAVVLSMYLILRK